MPGDPEQELLKHLRKHEPDRADALCKGAERVLRELMTFDTPYAGTAAERISFLRKVGSGLITRYIEGFALKEPAWELGHRQRRPELARRVDALKQLIWCYVILRPSLAVCSTASVTSSPRAVQDLQRCRLDKDKKKKLGLFPPMYVPLLEADAADETKLRAVVDLISA